MTTKQRRVAIVGAGWAGLATAVALTQRGHAVTLFEAAHATGGRARRLELGGRTLDNGQHVLLGAYRSTLALLQTVGVEPDRAFERRPLTLCLADADGGFELRTPHFGGRFALIGALARARGVKARDRVRALAHAQALRRVPAQDGPASSWLTTCGQPASFIRCLWGPLCLAALNAPLERASARLFARVLAEAFAHPRASDLLLPRTDLGGVLPQPAVEWLRARGQTVRTGTRVRAIEPMNGHWRLDEASDAYDDVVLATDPGAAVRLLPDDPASRERAQKLRALGAAPLATVYLDYGPDCRLEMPLLGRLDGPGHWLFDRALTGTPGVIAVVISGRGPHTDMTRDQLAAAVIEQLRTARPGWPRPAVVGVVREKRATFDPIPGCDALRTGVHGPCPGLWFAGDHVDTGLPATLEGAVRAGQGCAEAIHQRSQNE